MTINNKQMKLNLTQVAHNLLLFVITRTGEKEVGADSKEVDSLRRLNGDESSQRRFYLKAVKPLLEGLEKKAKDLADGAIEKWKTENPKGKEAHKQEVYDAKLNAYLAGDTKLNDEYKAIKEEMVEVELEDKTVDFIKKYFKEFGDKVGWSVADDEIISEISVVLK